MNPQMPPQHHAPYQGQLPQQNQNAGQQRQVPNGQPKPNQGQQQPQQQQQQSQPQQSINPYANYNPQLALWSLEKGKNVEGWEDVEPEKQYVSLQDIQNELAKFRRARNSVKRTLDEIPSPNCRRIIMELVQQENKELWKFNKTIRYSIAGVLIDWRIVESRRKSQRALKRVHVILETEPSGYQEPQNNKPSANGLQDANKSMKPNGAGQGQQQSGVNMPQKNNPQQGQNMGQFDQRPPPPPGGQGQMHGGNAPPPPPPPPGAGGHHGPNAPPPPPPPPGGGHPPPPNGANHFNGNVMPGAYPGTMPVPGMRPGQTPIQIINPQMMHNKKSKHKTRHDTSSSESHSSEWESETGSSGSEPIRARNVEHGDYVSIGRGERGRSKHSSRSRKSKHHGSHSRAKSLSRSRSRHRTSRRRRDSDIADRPPMGRRSASSSKVSSPELKPIRKFFSSSNNNSSSDERTHRHGTRRHRRDSFTPSPTGSPTKTYNKNKLGDFGIAQPMSRGSSWESWDRGSDTASFGSADRIYDTQRRLRNHDRPHGHTRQHHSSSFPPIRHPEDLDRRQEARYAIADDYPHDPIAPRGRDPYHPDQPFTTRPPTLHRRSTTADNNPFDTGLYRPAPLRAMTYDVDALERDWNHPTQQRYVTGANTPPRQANGFAMEGLKEALLTDYLNTKKEQQQQQRVPLRRYGNERRDFGGGEDEWDARHSGARGAMGTHRYAGY